MPIRIAPAGSLETSRRRAPTIIVLALACVAAACTGESGADLLPPADVRRVTSIRIEPATLGLAALDDADTLRATASDQTGHTMRDAVFVWASSDPGVAQVDSDGRVSAVALGSARVSASVDGVTGTAEVEVAATHAVQRNCGPCHTTLSGEHAALLFSIGSCWACHDLTGESHTPPARNHEQVSGGIVLEGAHETLPCAACHTPQGVTASPSNQDDCVACHREAYLSQHGASAFPSTCGVCHVPTSWTHISLDHVLWSGGFELKWMHGSLSCGACHEDGTFAVRFDPANEEDCYACHQAAYQMWHGAKAYPTTCLTCHDTSTWRHAVFDHLALSGGFALLGTHDGMPCTECHNAGTFGSVFSPSGDSDCVACHRDDYDGRHGGSGLPTTCLDCHTPTRWNDVTFDHAAGAGGFDLVGIHRSLSCTQCHVPGTFEAIFSPADEGDCIVCHQDDYDGPHTDSEFPPTCLSCHVPDTWQGAVFDHDDQYFPIDTGDHRTRWLAGGCLTCHKNGEDYRDFTCFGCHRHNETRSGRDHGGVDGYAYTSPACLACHPRGIVVEK